MKRVAGLLALLLWLGQALAEPQLLVRARLQPPPPYQVGSTLRLEVELLTSSWFTAAPQPAPLDLPGALVSPPNGQADNLTERIDGTPYFGLRLTYQISPTQAGTFRIPALPFRLQLGEASGPLTASSTPLVFIVEGGAGAAAGQHLLASAVQLEQQLEASASPLRVGDRLIRRVQVRARDAQAMLIPPIEFVEIPGLKRYPQAPTVTALRDGRGSVSGGLRIDSVSYVVERPGHYRLPAIELPWWDSQQQGARHSHLPAIDIEAEAADGTAAPFSLAADLQRLGRDRLLRLSGNELTVGGLILLALATYRGRRSWRRQWTRLQHWQMQRQQRRRQTEAWAWAELQRAWRHSPLPLQALYRWQQRAFGDCDLGSLLARLPADAASRLQCALQQHYADEPAGAVADTRLLQALRRLRRTQQRQRRQQARSNPLPALRPWAAEQALRTPTGINAPNALNQE